LLFLTSSVSIVSSDIHDFTQIVEQA